MSSLSGSDSDGDASTDSDDHTGRAASVLAERRRPQVAFGFGGAADARAALVYKAVLASASEIRAGIDAAGWTARLQAAMTTRRWRWAIFMCGGGHFAGAVYNGHEATASKTFHRYTTRRKQGGSQASNDQAKGKAKSAGAALRRYNERALQQDIRDLLTAWSAELQTCDCIFLVVPSTQARAIFFDGDGSPLRSDDPRVRKVPFSTRRPTKAEVARVHAQLATVQFVEHARDTPRPNTSVAAVDEAPVPPTPPAPPAPGPAAVAEVPEDTEEEDMDVTLLRQQLQATVMDPDRVRAAVRAVEPGAQRQRLLGAPVLDRLNALQWAAAAGDSGLVSLLLEEGANPAELPPGAAGRSVCMAHAVSPSRRRQGQRD